MARFLGVCNCVGLDVAPTEHDATFQAHHILASVVALLTGGGDVRHAVGRRHVAGVGAVGEWIHGMPRS